MDNETLNHIDNLHIRIDTLELVLCDIIAELAPIVSAQEPTARQPIVKVIGLATDMLIDNKSLDFREKGI